MTQALSIVGTTTRRLRSALLSTGRAGLDLIYPPVCTCCSAELESSEDGLLLCGTCRNDLVSPKMACPACGLTVPASNMSIADCSQCRENRNRFRGVARLGTYEGLLRSSVLRMKHAAERPLACALARLLLSVQNKMLQGFQADVVVPVPMHWRRRLWRGMNSPAIVAEQIAAALSLPCAAHILRRSRATRPQAELPPTRRRQNVRGAFKAPAHQDLSGARVLLVDDIMTTGATCNEGTRALLARGAAYVAVAILARAETP